MVKLGAVVDTAGASLVFTKLLPGISIPLTRARNGHLLLDLCKDWQSQENFSLLTSPVSDLNPDGKGSVCQEASDAFSMFEVKVVETQSDSRSEGSSVEQLVHGISDVQHVQQPESQENFNRVHSSSNLGVSPDHGTFCLDTGSPEGRGLSEDRPSDGHGGSISKEQDRSGEVRLAEGPICRPPGPTSSSWAMQGTSSAGRIWPRQPIGLQRPCSMVDVQGMPIEGDVRPHLGIEGNISQPRSADQGRGGEAADDTRERTTSRAAFHTSLGIGRSGNVSPSQVGEDQDREGDLAASQGERQGQDGRRCNSQHSGFQWGQEDSKEGSSPHPRAAGGQHGGLELGEGVARSSIVSHDLPRDILDDALCLHESDTSASYVTKSLMPEQKDQIAEGLREAHEEFVESIMAVKGSTCDLLEVCCGPDSNLTRTVHDMGGVAYRVGIENNMDLTTEIGASRAREFAHKVKPRWMWFSVPCGANSPLQGLNQRTPQQIKKLKQKRRKNKIIIRNSIKMAEEQLSRGGHVGWEWPLGNGGWKLPEVVRFFKSLEQEGILFRTILHGCQVGVVAPDTGNPMKKPWQIMSTSIHLHQTLNLQCPGNHVHDECVGHGRATASALYPIKMCKKITRVVLEHDRTDKLDEVFGNWDDEEKPWDEKELKYMREVVRKLHVKSGHPTNQALYNMLKARGVDKRVLALAKELRCDDCMEIKLPAPHMGVSLHTCDTLWHTVQVDVGYFTVGSQVVAVLFMIDEASRFLVCFELFRHEKSESRNATTEEIIKGLEQAWVQYHGFPNRVRSDPEGCFRGTAFEDWCTTRGIEWSPCAAEDHSQIGIVEATLGKIKNDIRAFLRSSDSDPFSAILQMVSAHNELDRIGGFAPAQWAYGRLPSLDGRLFEGGNADPVHSTEGALGSDLRANLQLRVMAEEQYRRSQAAMKISRAMNSQTRPHQVFLPGDLVYYRRFKTPMSQGPSHAGLDQPKMGLSRWYGPGRVLCTETRSSDDSAARKPGSIVWLIVAGRLKRCSPQQLRHCSEREKLLAENSEAVSMPWSFNSLMHLVERGQFQRYDEVADDDDNPDARLREARQRAPRVARSRSRPVERSRSRPAAKSEKDPTTTAKRAESKGQATDKREGERRPKGSREGAPTQDEERKKSRRQEKEDPGQQTGSAKGASSSSALAQHPPFVAAQERAREQEKSGKVPAKEEKGKVSLAELIDDESIYQVSPSDEVEQVCFLEVPLPETKREFQKFTRDSSSWVSNKVKKGAELKWKDIPKDKVPSFYDAIHKELTNWVKEAAVKRASKDVPRERLLKMRWIFTIKQDGSPKARIVIIGYADPDLESLTRTSPTMTRRTRGLFLTKCAMHSWTVLKGDVRGAFLQGLESEREREIYAKPVVELAHALGGGPQDNVQILKACYGLANAPAQWHVSVTDTMAKAGFKQLQTEPCGWILEETTPAGSKEVVGIACAHVDDFLFAGEPSSAKWQSAIEYIYNAYQWTPWEADSFMHCGVQVLQKADGGILLNHAEYCVGIEQIFVAKDRSEKDVVSDAERQQLRGALGAIQWRVYQSAPQHGAKLSILQSQITTATVHTIRETNKLIREVYHGRNVGLKYSKLNVTDPLEVNFVVWTDAAVGNRRDLSSSGGYFLAATEPSIQQGHPAQINPISWKAGKLPRIARSSLSAEIQAFSIAEEELMYCRLQWLEMNGVEIPLKEAASVLPLSTGIMVTDARSLYDVIFKGPNNTSGYGLKEKYSVLDMMSVFQRLSQGKTITRWVHSDAQIADSLTKNVANSSLIRVLCDGLWTLVDDPNFTSSKKLRQKARQERVMQEALAVFLGACEFEKVQPFCFPAYAYA